MPTVVVVDDNPIHAEILKSLLEDEGYRVVVARDGQAALGVAAEERPDLILSDLMMPRLDGLGMAMHVSVDPALRGIPVVLMSAGKTLLPGGDGVYRAFLKKPFLLEDVLQTVEGQIGKGGAGKLQLGATAQPCPGRP